MALRPWAEALEAKTGVPAAMSLALAAVESRWGQRPAAAFNPFGLEQGHLARAFGSYAEAFEALGEHLSRGRGAAGLAAYRRSGDLARYAASLEALQPERRGLAQRLMAVVEAHRLA